MKTVKTILAAFALLSLIVGCQKSTDNNLGKKVTVTVTAPNTDVLKVAFEQDANPDAGMALTWEDGDQITINGETFTIKDGFAGQTTAEFEGNYPGAAPYDITYDALPAAFAEQTQAADASTAHLKYGVAIVGSDSYADVQFTDAWATAHGGTLEQSSVLRLRALLPDGVAATIRSVTFKATEDIFGGSDELKVNITSAGDADSDNILNVYASLPAGPEVTIPAGTEVLMQFQYGQYDNDLYTAHYQFADASAVIPGTVTAFKINRSGTGAYPDIRDYANASKADIGTSANPYLIGDKNQLYYMRTALDTDDVIKYFKLVDDVDWTRGVAASAGWRNLNNVKNGSNTWTRGVNLDGNNKTIYGLNDSMFYVLMGEVKNLTLDHSSISVGNYVVGALAAYITEPNTVINNVDVKNSTVANDGTRAAGAIVGRVGINDTSNSAPQASLFATITDCDITNTNVTGGPVGGLIGWANAEVQVSGCTYDGGTVATGDKPYAGGIVARSENYESTFTDCHVTNATINMTGLTTAQTHYGRGGGFSGMLSTRNTVKGCSVGTSSQHVKVIFPAAENVNNKKNLNCGGFTGINYGLITKDDSDNHCTAYVDVVTATAVNTELHLGGFVGYNTGVIEYSDAVVSFSSSASTQTNLTYGYHIGGFVGYLYNETATQLGKIEHCTVSGNVSGSAYVGGFAGYVLRKEGLETHPILNDCHASVPVTVSGHYSGGLAAYVEDATITDCSASGNITATGKNRAGGFIGQVHSATIDHCHSTGDVGCNAYSAAFLGCVCQDSGESVSVTRCYSSGSIEGTGNQIGGLVGTHLGRTSQDVAGSLTITNCYYSGDLTANNRSGGILSNHFAGTSTLKNCYASGAITCTGPGGMGGIVGWVEKDGLSVTSCMPWNSSIQSTVTDSDQHYPLGAVIGYANKGNSPKVIVASCYRRKNIANDFQECPGNADNVIEQHGFITTAAAIPQRKSTLTYGYYHHGRNTNYGLTELVTYPTFHPGSPSVIAEDWDPAIWDLTGAATDYPTLL